MYARLVAGSATGCESTQIFHDPRPAGSAVAIDRSRRSKSSEEQRTTATNSLQSRVVSRRSGHAAPLLLLPFCSLLLPVHSHAHHHFSFSCVYHRRSFVHGRNAFLLPARTYTPPHHSWCFRRDAINLYTLLSFGCLCIFIHTSFSSIASPRRDYLFRYTNIYLSLRFCKQLPRDCIYMNMPRDVVMLVLRDEHTCLLRTHASQVPCDRVRPDAFPFTCC